MAGRNVRKVMARLNPPSMPLVRNGSRGTGEPELTAIDIAAALAASNGDHRRRLAIDVACLRWWPARMEGPAVVVGHREEKRKRDDGKIEVIRLPIEAPAETEPFIRLASLIARCLGRHAHRKIQDEELAGKVLEQGFLDRWARVVIHEHRNPSVCAACRHFGRPGEVAKAVTEQGKVVRFEWALCDGCNGTGSNAWGKERRAMALRIRAVTFRHHLNDGHDGAIAMLRELELRGVRFISRQFSDH